MDRVYVVTNSDATAIIGKLRRFARENGLSQIITAAWLNGHVIGNARKHVSTADPAHVRENMTIEGLAWPIQIRRGHYFQVLDGLRQKHGLAWSQLKVVCDVFEFDAVLPLELGARIGLLFKPGVTPRHEIQIVSNHPRAKVFQNFSEVCAFVQG